jgi:hypothetical protein
MGQDAEVALAFATVVGAPADRAAEPALVSAEGALDLPPLTEHSLVSAALRPRTEPTGHLAAVLARRRGGATAGIDRDHRRADAQILSRETVVGFGVERRVGQHPVPGQTQGGQEQNGSELRGVVGRAECDGGPGDEVGVRIDRSGQFRPTAGGVLALGAGDEVPRRVPAIQSGGIDGDGRGFGDQAALGSGRNGAFEEVEEDPPFSSRPSALQTVE